MEESKVRLVFSITTTILVFAFARVSVAAEGDRCASIVKLESIAKSERRRIVLTSKAFALADCGSSKTATLDGLLQSPVLNWWVLHAPDEDVRRFTDIAERNRAVLDAYLKRSKKARGSDVYEFWGADLRAVLTAASHECSVTFRVSGTSNVRIAANQQFENAGEILCQGLAVILAVHGISVAEDRDGIVVLLPDGAKV